MTGNEVSLLVTKAIERIGGIENHIKALSQTQGEHAAAVQKIFGPGKSQAGVMPGRGMAYDSLGRDFMDIIDPRRAKSIGNGFGDYLADLCRITAPEKFPGSDPVKIRKRMEDIGAWPGDQRPNEVVTKAWEPSGRVMKAPLADKGATGGYVAPPTYGNELLRLMAEESFLRPLVRQVPMTGADFYYPTVDRTLSPPTDGSSFYGGLVWRSLPEASNIRTLNETEPVIRQVHLVARTWGGICRASNQLLADNNVALDTVLTTLFKEAAGWLYDFMILNGNGANQSLGVRNAPALINITKTSSGLFLLLDAANMLAQMLPASWDKCVFIAHPSVLPQLITMTTAVSGTPNSFLVWLNPAGTGNDGPAAKTPPAILLGRPLYFTEKVPKLAAGSKGSVLLIDPDKVLLGDRMAIQIESSIYPYWETAQVGWRIMLRFDSQPEVNGPVILNSANDGSNYTVSPYVSLTD